MPNCRDVTSPISPIELLLPHGCAEAAIVLGAGCPAPLVPAATVPPSEDVPVDLVVIAPSRAEEQDKTWIDQAAERAVRGLAPGGVTYVLPASARRLRHDLSRRGLRQTDMLLHVPDVSRSRYVVPIGTPAAHYVLSGHVAMSRSRRHAAAALMRSRRLAALGPTGVIFQRDPPAPLAAWLFELHPSLKAGSVLASRGGSSGGALLFLFPPDVPLADAVAKVTPRALQELDALRTVGPTAARAGVRVPRVLATAMLGGAAVVLQSAVSGEVASQLLRCRRLSPGRLQERLASWLARWGQLSGRMRPLGNEDLERLVLSPAARLAPDRPAYRAYLADLCGAAEGQSCRFVASHGDLTSANILVDDPAHLGVVDWEEASEATLPLLDFFYATADAVAALEAYADRPASVAACFATGGHYADHVAGLTGAIADALEIAPAVRELCFHACWLHHAANEAGRARERGVGPFGAILREVASAPERYRLLAP